jgi:hypothetical protein
MERIVRIRRCADLSIRRAIGFAYIGIAMAMMAMIEDGTATARMGAILSTFVIVVLVAKALNARARPYKRTELWIILEKHHELPEDRAQDIIGNVLRERYLWHAQAVASGCAALWLFAFAGALLR